MSELTAEQLQKRTESIRNMGKESGLFRACMDSINLEHSLGQKLRTAMIGAGLFTDALCYAELLFCFGMATVVLERKLAKVEGDKKFESLINLLDVIHEGLDMNRFSKEDRDQQEHRHDLFGFTYAKDLDWILLDTFKADDDIPKPISNFNSIYFAHPGITLNLIERLLALEADNCSEETAELTFGVRQWQGHISGRRNPDPDWDKLMSAIRKKMRGALGQYVKTIQNSQDPKELAAAVFILWGPLLIGGGYTVKPLVLKASFGDETCCNLFTLVIGDGRAERRQSFITAFDQFIKNKDEEGKGDEIDVGGCAEVVKSCRYFMDLNNKVMQSVEILPWWIRWASKLNVEAKHLPYAVIGSVAVAFVAIVAWRSRRNF